MGPPPEAEQAIEPLTDQASHILPEDEAPLKPWYRVWLQAFFRPTQDSVLDLVHGHERYRIAPYLWLAASSAIGFTIWRFPEAVRQGLTPTVGWLLAPVALGILTPVFVRIGVAVTHFIARSLLQGEGTTAGLFFYAAAVLSPGTLIGGLIALVSMDLPSLGYLGIISQLYQTALLVIAVKAIYGLGWAGAVIALLPYILLWLVDFLV